MFVTAIVSVHVDHSLPILCLLRIVEVKRVCTGLKYEGLV